MAANPPPRMPVWTTGNRLASGINACFSVTYDDEEVIGVGQETGTSNAHLKTQPCGQTGRLKALDTIQRRSKGRSRASLVCKMNRERAYITT